MAAKFEMNNLGKLTYYLGIEVYQHEGEILLKQDRYAMKIFEETGMSECNLSHTPMEQNVKLSKYMQDPKESHGAALKQVLRYLCGTISYGLTYTRTRSVELVGYSDSSHNVGEDDGKSTGGHMFYLDKIPISWCSQKQEITALSSCEAEFMTATETAKQTIWLQELLSEIIREDSKKVTIRVDNRSATALTYTC
ncbi:secreted RxLR effector protein 161-like [Raphanus sativus]|uniref:Secreted RxLR effector protein 161-like n=1 Tax=Raphanus sativus TaxID=3726 RepID=A0A9W3DEZ0_RAPSA|nr:secreted RxLR effector protein 161-like [Raphanus sativus]